MYKQLNFIEKLENQRFLIEIIKYIKILIIEVFYNIFVLMQKIYRRKNEQISKDFLCTEGCGKAYGSYAALYTHIKNKHAYAKPPQMKLGAFKPKATGRKGRPLVIVKDDHSVHQTFHNKSSNNYDCKICQKVECQCSQSLNQEDIDHTINLLADQYYIKFVNSIGQLALSQNFTWVRSSQEDFQFMTPLMVRQLAQKYKNQTLTVSNKWMDYLSFSSRFWDCRYINELYLTKQNTKDIEIFFANHEGQFDNIKKCCELKHKQFKQFVDLVKFI